MFARFIAASLVLLALMVGDVRAQVPPPNSPCIVNGNPLAFGVVPTAGQWNACFQAKQDALLYVPVNKTGDTMTGRLALIASTTFRAGLGITPGVAPTSPVNGDVWVTAAGIFVQINGATVQLSTGGATIAPGSANQVAIYTGTNAIGGVTTLPTGLTLPGAALITATGTAAPSSASGQTSLLGTLAATPTLSNTGQALIYNMTANGLILQGNGSSIDVAVVNKIQQFVCSVGTGTQTWLCNTLALTNPLSVANGGTGQITANAARQSSGLNVWGDQGSGHGDANATIGNTERFAYTNAAFTAARTWTLPAANVTGQPYAIRVADLQGTVTGTNTLTIQRAGSDTINGGTTSVMNSANAAQECYSDGVSKWSCQIIGVGLTTAANNTALSNISGGTATPTANNLATIGSSKVLLQCQAASNSASIVFNSTVITSTYNNYEVTIDSYLPVTNTTSLFLTVSDDNGATYKSSSYQWARQLFNAGSTTFSGAVNAAAANVAVIDSVADNNVGRPMSGKVTFMAPAAAASRPVNFKADMWGFSGNLGGAFAYEQLTVGGYEAALAGILNNIKFATSSGNISIGNFCLYGIRNT
jgi:hypothetical protein